jgi:hypothetical protein
LRLGHHAKLRHHAKVVPHPSMFDGLTVPQAHEVHVVLSHRATGRRHAHQRAFMGAAHGQATRYDIHDWAGLDGDMAEWDGWTVSLVRV